MKKLLLVGLLLWSFLLSGQNNLYCLYDFAGWYRLSTINPTTGIISQIAPLPTVAFYVLGNKQCISTHDSTYTFAGHDGTDARLYTVTLDSAIMLHQPVFNNVVVGLQYNCNDSTIYAIKENGGAYDFVSVDKTTGLTTTLGTISGVTAYVGDSFTLDEDKGRYHFFGLFGGQIKLYSVDITTGNVVSSPFFPDNLTGIAYNCKDSTVYGLWEDGTDYKLEAINPSNGTHSTVGILTNIDPGFVVESASIDANGQYVYRGFSNSNSVLVTIDVATAAVLNTVSFTDNVSGMDHYACCAEPITTSLKPEITLKTFHIFPNPASTELTLAFGRRLKNAAISLYDLNGKLVVNHVNVTGLKVRIDVVNLPSGVYIVELNELNAIPTRNKVIIQ